MSHEDERSSTGSCMQGFSFYIPDVLCLKPTCDHWPPPPGNSTPYILLKDPGLPFLKMLMMGDLAPQDSDLRVSPQP